MTGVKVVAFSQVDAPHVDKTVPVEAGRRGWNGMAATIR
jgi:hypothetical protein